MRFALNWVIAKIKKFNILLGTLSGYILFVMNGIVFYAVIMRYIFRMPPTWTTEIATYMLLFISFIPAGFVHQNDGHIQVNFVVAQLNKKSLKWINIFCDLLGFAYFVLLFWQSSRLVIKAFKGNWLSMEMSIPLVFPLILLPIGCVLLATTSLAKALGILFPLKADQRAEQ